MQPEQDTKYSEAVQARLDRLYIRDGRMDKSHPMHGTYTGLHVNTEGGANAALSSLGLQEQPMSGSLLLTAALAVFLLSPLILFYVS